MLRLPSFAIAVASVASILFASIPARAAVDAHGEIALLGGYGTNPGLGSSNVIGPGFGGRLGLDFDGFYLGGRLYAPRGVAEDRAVWQVGADLGYGFDLADHRVTLRPQLGIGTLRIGDFVDEALPAGASGVGAAFDFDSVPASQTRIYTEPALVALLHLGRVVFVGADAGILLVPGVQHEDGLSSTLVSVTLHAQIGLRF